MSNRNTAGIFFFVFFFVSLLGVGSERAIQTAGCDSRNEEIGCICVSVWKGTGQRTEEGMETCSWLEVKSQPLDER